MVETDGGDRFLNQIGSGWGDRFFQILAADKGDRFLNQISSG